MDFSFGLGDEELALMATGRGLGEDESSLSGFGVTFARPIVFTTFSSKVVVCGHCLVTLSLTINETLK